LADTISEVIQVELDAIGTCDAQYIWAKSGADSTFRLYGILPVFTA